MRKALAKAAVRTGLALALIAVAVPVAGAAITCIFDSPDHEVIVRFDGNNQVPTLRVEGNQILVEGAQCETATTANTDQIVIVDTAQSGSATVEINLAGGPFVPGLTNEEGESDEIEFRLRLVGGNNRLEIEGGAGPDNIRAGTAKLEDGTKEPRVNLNAGEDTGVDADLSAPVSLRVTVDGGDGGDNIAGSGGAGTGRSFNDVMHVSGLGGSDIIIGGTRADVIEGQGTACELSAELCSGGDDDDLSGGGGADRITGGVGEDRIAGGSGSDDLFGSEGRDKLFGGGGDDRLQGGAGDDALNGGPGRDSCDGQQGEDTLAKCE